MGSKYWMLTLEVFSTFYILTYSTLLYSTFELFTASATGAFLIVEMLFTSSLLAIVGAGEQPYLSPRRLCLFNTTTGAAIRELNFLTTVLSVRVNKKRLAVILQDKTYIYDIGTLRILETIDTVPNLKVANFRIMCIFPRFGWLLFGSSCKYLKRFSASIQCNGTPNPL